MLGDGSSGSGASSTISIKSTSAPTINESGGSITDTSEPTPEPEPVSPPAPEPVNSQPAEPVQNTPNFRNVNDTVYATKSMNVRNSWSTSSSKIGSLAKNQAVTRTGIGDNGWSRISYNGSTAYVLTSLITTIKPEEPEKNEENPKENNVDNPEENLETENSEETPEENPEEVSEDIAENSEDEIYKDIVAKVGTIPEVGMNYNIYAFIGICFISILSYIFIIKKSKRG